MKDSVRNDIIAWGKKTPSVHFNNKYDQALDACSTLSDDYLLLLLAVVPLVLKKRLAERREAVQSTSDALAKLNPETEL